MSQAVKIDRALGCISSQIPVACSIPIANLKAVYRQTRKVRANPKSHIGLAGAFEQKLTVLPSRIRLKP